MYIIKLSLPIDTPSFVVCDPASTLGAWLTSDPMEARTWGTPASAECWIEQHHLHATVEPQIPPVISLPCPLGCGRTAAAEGSCIHYCVRRERGLPTEREYVGTFDGAAMFYGDSYHDVQVQLDDYALGLLQDGLVDVVPNAVYARPGEVAPEVHYTDLPAGHRLADDDEPGWFYGQEDGNLAWITDAPTFVALPEPINVALCDACTQIATQQIGGRTWCDACAPTLPAAPQAHAPGAEEETAAPPADGGQSCHCGADVAYLVRESQRGHETIHRVCEECYRREFYENEENSWAWEILYCDYCANPTPAIDLLPPLALTSGFVPPQNPVCGTCRAQFLSAPATTPPTRGESAAMIAAETICVSTPARPARRATNLLFVRTGAAGWRCQAGHVFQTLASALPIACPTCDGAPVSPCTVCGGPHRPTLARPSPGSGTGTGPGS